MKCIKSSLTQLFLSILLILSDISEKGRTKTTFIPNYFWFLLYFKGKFKN